MVTREVKRSQGRSRDEECVRGKEKSAGSDSWKQCGNADSFKSEVYQPQMTLESERKE